MVKAAVLSLLLAFAGARCLAQFNYATALIPDSLRKGAHTVIRESRESYVISSLSKSTYSMHEVITVLDPHGKQALSFGIRGSSLARLEDADVYVYDSLGRPMQHIRQKDMEKSGWGEELVEDGIYTYCSVNDATYPITVERDYTLAYKGSKIFPEFDLSNADGSIQQETLTVTLPKSMTFRYHGHHAHLEPTIADAGKDDHVYTWTASGIKTIPSEAGAPADWGPAIYMAPTQFELAGYAGDMTTWQSFGKWAYDLNKNAIVLPEASRQLYLNMVKDAPTDLDKARILYRYLQKNFRYVAIELGIGGDQAFPATFTEKKKYGDCKGLSCYLSACLTAVGVKSYPALVNYGDLSQPVDPSFPQDRFNHVILCIPQPHDSVWLECTSNHTDFGVLGAFTENRNALLLTENGGVLVHTPSSTAMETRRDVFTRVNLSEDGSGKAEVAIKATGEDRYNEIGYVYEQNHDDQKRFLVEEMEFPQPDDFTINLEQVDSPLLRTHIALAFEKVPDFTAGDKMFLRPHIYHLHLTHLPESKNRTQSYFFDHPFEESDTTCYQLPTGYVVDELPQARTFSCPHASYTSNYWYDTTQKAVYSYTSIILKDRMVPASDYDATRLFFSQAIKEETAKIVVKPAQ
ncbi:transglutaminase-like domain-containing protein [Dinghuibacter silviterrae]|uniref:Transglutaminase superfamily protein n=1 Tax=Dinghuibacter silviterrae TaxID=1539049 RepID=A0A4R8DW98_9BACT|nr:transglutaminase-like domain-containing protein [Dinghuibacter silviterrae]TDX01687.1 transglutaminase superfamily protein [Dinghuibacter silviterrae]